ncbi:MAG: type II toxin-antitoxin system VapC family toxin [Conexibacter sp.]
MGAIAFDADVLIGFFNRDDAHHAASRRLITGLEQSGDRLLIGASVYAEVIVGPLRAGRAEIVDAALAALGVEVVGIDRDVAREAARLRTRHVKLRLPDAMALAVARREGADFKTFDRRLARIAAAN